MVTKCYTAFKIVSFGIMVRFIKLDVLFCLIDLGLRIWVYTLYSSRHEALGTSPLIGQLCYFRCSGCSNFIGSRLIELIYKFSCLFDGKRISIY